MSTPAPTTPDQTPRKVAGVNRSSTLPSSFAPARPNETPEIGATKGLETLYFHPDVKVLKFSAGLNSRSGNAFTGASGPNAQQEIGSIPWASPSEQTVASGPLEIYRVPGSVSFLRSGSLLHAIMPKSQCWCVDGVSKFAIRVLTNTYYRIELPGETSEDVKRVEELKLILQNVLHYERTACPFARTFTVELPEEIPTKRRRRRSHGPAKRWRLEKAYSWKPEDGDEPPVEEEEEEEEDDDDGSGSLPDSEEDKSTSPDEDSPAEDSEFADQVRGLSFNTPPRPTVRDRVRDFSARRSFTAPIQTAMQSTPPSRLRSSVASASEERRDSSPSSTTHQMPTELRTFQAIPTVMPPSPPDSSAGYEFAEPTRPYRQSGIMPSIESQVEPSTPDRPISQAVFSEEVLRSAAPGLEELDVKGHDTDVTLNIAPEPHEPLSVESVAINMPGDEGQQSDEMAATHRRDCGDASSSKSRDSIPIAGGDDPDPFAQIQARIQARRSIGGANDPRLGSYSPYHTPSTSIASRRPPLSHRNSQHQQALTAAIVNKACAVFFGPPAHLVKIMLRIAARLANGTFARNIFASPANESSRIPGTFDLDGSDVEDLQESDADVEEDDFGVPLRSPIRLAARADTTSHRISSRMSNMNMKERRAWEVD